MTIKLYVGGLSYNTTDEQLNAMLGEYGKVLSAKIITDRDTGSSKGFGFVEMADLKEGQQAIKALDGTEINGRKLAVNQARAQDKRSSGFTAGYRR